MQKVLEQPLLDTVAARLTPEDQAKLDALAQASGCTTSAVLRLLIRMAQVREVAAASTIVLPSEIAARREEEAAPPPRERHAATLYRDG